MIFLEIPRGLSPLTKQARGLAEGIFRPISRQYDRLEHETPRELGLVASILRGARDAATVPGSPATAKGDGDHTERPRAGHLATVLAAIELGWGDLGLALSIPGHGLGNAAIDALATREQQARFAGKWAAMALTEPGAGSDLSQVRTTASAHGDGWILDGEKTFVTSGERCDLVVVWATLDPAAGLSAIKPFAVEKGTPGMRVARLERKLGMRASDTASLVFEGCLIPRHNLLGDATLDGQSGLKDALGALEGSRPIVAAMAVGVARAALERTRELATKDGVRFDYGGRIATKNALEAELMRLEAELEAATLLTMRAAWLADQHRPNAMEASMARAKAGHVANALTLRCVELCGAVGYAEEELLEKWARDSKVLDIFEGTRQVQLLSVARRLLGLDASALR